MADEAALAKILETARHYQTSVWLPAIDEGNNEDRVTLFFARKELDRIWTALAEIGKAPPLPKEPVANLMAAVDRVNEWIRWVEALDTEVSRLRNLSAAAADDVLPAVEGAAAAPRTPRLAVDIAKLTVTLDGKSFDANSEQALRWLKVLIDHPGEWISAVELSQHDPELLGVRTDKVKAALPENVSKLIDSETGKGSRIRLA